MLSDKEKKAISDNVESSAGAARIPEYMHGAISRYVVHGIEPGGFLYSFLCGNLFPAIRCADNINIKHFKEYAIFLHNYVPSVIYGSKEIVDGWIRDSEYRGKVLKSFYGGES